MKKLFAASLILVAIICFSFQNRDSILAQRGPSVFEPILSENTNDSTDLDAQMEILQKEMEVWQEKMKPFEKAMKGQQNNMKPFQEEMKVWQEKMKPLEKEMRELEKKMKKATTDDEREVIGEQMSNVSDRMGMVGDQMGKVGEKMGEVGDEMGKHGDDMGRIGEEMGKIGEKMGLIGEKIEARNHKIFTWFFNELKKDGLISEGKCSIILESNIFIINGKTLSTEQIQKYKKGMEQRLGKPLKADFSVYFKGTLDKISDDDFDFSGMNSSNY
jgi:chromosome segregation ATPase